MHDRRSFQCPHCNQVKRYHVWVILHGVRTAVCRACKKDFKKQKSIAFMPPSA